MRTETDKKIGVAIMFASLLLFFVFFIHFNLDGAVLDLKNGPLMLKMLFTTAMIPAGLYCGLYFYGGSKLANQIGGGAAVLWVLCFILAALLH